MALGWHWCRAWFPDDAVDAAAFCVAGVALGDMDVHPVWQECTLVHQQQQMQSPHSKFRRGLGTSRR